MVGKIDGPAPLLLVVDGDCEFAIALEAELQSCGFRTCSAGNLREAEMRLTKKFVDLLLINTTLEKKCGIKFVENFQRRTRPIPVIFFLDRHSTNDRLAALEIGDDVMQKPLEMKELMARIRAVLRRHGSGGEGNAVGNNAPVENEFIFCSALVSPRELAVIFPDGRRKRIGGKELGLMAFLEARKGSVVRRSELIRGIWGPGRSLGGRSLEQYIVKIRKLFFPQGSRSIETLRGVGYRYADGEKFPGDTEISPARIRSDDWEMLPASCAAPPRSPRPWDPR
jgi:DNA-binding response OmpR family regulator